MGVIISIINQKGGVGKTTTAVNLAAYLADRGKKTLLIDEDAQGNSTSGLSKDVEFKKNLYDVLLNDADAEEAIIKTAVKKLSLLPSSIDLAGADIELSAMDGREYILKKKIEALKDAYDFILIDCPPSLGLMTLNALVASDSILIPIQAEFYALEGLSQLQAESVAPYPGDPPHHVRRTDESVAAGGGGSQDVFRLQGFQDGDSKDCEIIRGSELR